jgi:hypothetical protein
MEKLKSKAKRVFQTIIFCVFLNGYMYFNYFPNFRTFLPHVLDLKMLPSLRNNQTLSYCETPCKYMTCLNLHAGLVLLYLPKDERKTFKNGEPIQNGN